MFETQIDLAGRSLVLRALANLQVSGADRADVWIHLPEGAEADVQAEPGETSLEVTLRRDAEVEVPAGTPLRIQEARRNVALDGLDAAVEVEAVRGNLRARRIGSLKVTGDVHGNLKVRDCAETEAGQVRGNAKLADLSQDARLSRVAGNLAARGLGGELEVGTIGGNAALSQVEGAARLGRVGANLAGQELLGGLEAEAIGGNLALRGPWTAGQAYRASAGGNVAVKLGAEDSARVRIRAGGHLVSAVPLQAEEGWQAGVVGAGEAELEIQSGGNLVLGGGGHGAAGGGWAILGADLAQEAVHEAMDRLQTRLESIDWDRASHKVERAMGRLERKLQRLERRAERAAARWERDRARAPEAARRPDARPARGRLEILEQLSQGEISVDEALQSLQG